MLGYPPTFPRGARRLIARPADPQGSGQPSPPPPPYSPQNCRTPLGVTHWLAAAPLLSAHCMLLAPPPPPREPQAHPFQAH